MLIKLAALFLKWSWRDVGILAMICGFILMVWFLYGFWIFGVLGVIVFIIGLLILVKSLKS